MLSPDDVDIVYRAILGREPESQAVVDTLIAEVTSTEELSLRLLGTDEFRRRMSMGLRPATGSQWVCAEIRRGLKLWIDLLDSRVASRVLQDDWELAETNFILSTVRPGDTVVDIGTNVGWSTILAAQAVGPTGRVHGFEPRAEIAARLNQSVEANGFADRCMIHPVAVGHVHTLDARDIGGPVRLIKIDAGGGEAAILGGAAGLLARDRPIVVLTLSAGGTDDGDTATAPWTLLQGEGYRVFSLSDRGLGQEVHDLPPGPSASIYRDRVLVALPPAEVNRYLNLAMDQRVASLEDDLATIQLARTRERARADAAEQQQQETARKLAKTEADVAAALAAAACAEAEVATTRLEIVALETKRNTLRADLNEAGIRAYRVENANRQEREALLRQHEQERQTFARAAGDSDEQRAATQRMLDYLQSRHNAALAHADRVSAERDMLRNSTMWQVTWPIRQIGGVLPPKIRRFAARAARITWWSATLQLPHRFRLRSAARGALALHPVPPSPLVDVQPRPAEILPPPLVAAMPPSLVGVDCPVAMIIDQVWPQPDRDAGSIEAVNMTETLIQLGYRVVFAALNPLPNTEHYREQHAARGAYCFGPEDGSSVQAYITAWGEAICLFVLTRYDAGGQFLELIRADCPHAKVIFNTIDLHFLREEREAQLTNNTAIGRFVRRTRDREQFLTLRSDATLVVSSAEQVLLTASVPGAHIVLLPLARAGRTTPVPPFDGRRNIGFVGGYSHSPNVDAVRFFLAEVWPLVCVALPDCWFMIAGAGLPEGIVTDRHERVIYQGHVLDLDAWFDELRLTVAPIRFGAGLKGKVISSMAAGIPCVGTTIALEGIPIIPGDDALVGDAPEVIAGELIRLYRDPALWAQLSDSGRAKAEQVFSLAGYRRRVLDCLISIGLPCLTPPDTL